MGIYTRNIVRLGYGDFIKIVNNLKGAQMTLTDLPLTTSADTLPVGVIVPYDMALDRELWRWAEADMSLLFTRTRYENLPVTAEQARAISRPKLVQEGVRALSAVEPRAYVYGCTSGSFIRGLVGEQNLVRTMTAAGGAPAFTTSGALLEAVRALGAETIATATPYDDAITAQFAAFFAEAGIHLVSNSNLGLDGKIWTVPYQRTYDLVRAADSDRADAVVISCTNLPTYDILAELEADLGKPVISANQATMWSVLRHFGRSYTGPGLALSMTEPPLAAESAPSPPTPEPLKY